MGSGGGRPLVARLPIVSGDEFVRILGQIGFIWDYTQGSHMILLNPDGLRGIGATTPRARKRSASSLDKGRGADSRRILGALPSVGVSS